MNMHVGSLGPPIPPAPRKQPSFRRFACCPMCGSYDLQFTLDRTSARCLTTWCDSIMPGEWFS